jgi:hypothetical protein
MAAKGLCCQQAMDVANSEGKAKGPERTIT